jgi:hypothetical protein
MYCRSASGSQGMVARPKPQSMQTVARELAKQLKLEAVLEREKWPPRANHMKLMGQFL